MPLRISRDATPTRPHVPAEDGLADKPVSGDAMALTTFDAQIEAAYALGNKPLRDRITALEAENAELLEIVEYVAASQYWSIMRDKARDWLARAKGEGK